MLDNNAPTTIEPGGCKSLIGPTKDKPLVLKSNVLTEKDSDYNKTYMSDTVNFTARKALRRIIRLQNKMADAQADYKRAVKRLKTSHGPVSA